jgi:hypothetical protein
VALSRLQRITLILFVTVVGNWVVASLTGYSLIGGDLFTFLLIVFVLFVVVSVVWTLLGKWLYKN